MDLFNDYGAEFSPCRQYRFSLWRIWDKAKPCVLFIGLNPSTVNETSPDPTINRVMGFAKKWGYGGVYMMNCFPFVSTDPNKIQHHERVDYNDQQLSKIGASCAEIIFAWGKFKIVSITGRDKQLIQMFPHAKALIISKDGSPRHPLYVRGDVTPVLFLGSSK